MSIELDWQIVEEDVPPPDDIAPTTPPRPHRRISLKWLIALALALVAAIAAAAVYTISTYRQQLERAEREIRPIAKLEAQAIAKGDRDSFLALQDPDDPGWRTMQAQRFGQLERDGLPEFGWKAAGTAPQMGSLTLEPGGARLDVTYHLSVTQPLPGGPTSITLRMPQFYRQTPSGWVRANPSTEYWGTWRSHGGKYFAMLYTRRDADVLEPLIPRMDEMLSKMCTRLPCPPQPIYLIFENSPDSLARLTDFSYGFENSFILKLPSPHLFGVPADARSRDELYRAIGMRIVQALVTEASRGHPNLPYLFSRQLLYWELAEAGLDGPFITPEITRTLSSSLQAGMWPPLATLPLRARAAGMEPTADEVMMPSLALAFLEQQVGVGTVERLIPAMQTNVTLGEGISAALKLNPRSLEPAWLAYLRKQAGLPVAQPDLPTGELTLTCTVSRTRIFSILRIGVNGSNIQVVEGQVQDVPQPTWSPDGKKLAYLRNGRVLVMDANTWQSETVEMGYPIGTFGWLPDPPGRLWVQVPGTNRMSSYVVNLDTGAETEQDGFNHVWSPDGTRVAYSTSEGRTSIVWVAATNGRDAQQIAPGYGPVWSPDSKRVAFLTGPGAGTSAFLLTGEIQIADVATGAVSTLVSTRDLSKLMNGAANIQWTGNLTWSPDGSTLAVSVTQPNRPALFAFDANTGAVRARWYGTRSARWFSLAWSADSRYVGFWVLTTAASDVGTVGILNVTTGQTTTLSGRDFDWSPDGKWLAVVQEPDSVFLITPDFSAMRWLEMPSCLSVAWRPEGH